MRVVGELEPAASSSPLEVAERIAKSLRASGAFRVVRVGTSVTFASAAIKNFRPPLLLVNGSFTISETGHGASVRYGAAVQVGPLLLLFFVGGAPLLLVALFTGASPLGAALLTAAFAMAGIAAVRWAATRWVQSHARSGNGA